MLQLPFTNGRTARTGGRLAGDSAIDDGASTAPKKILAVASGGGHWVQLMRLMPAFSGHRVAFVSTLSGHRAQIAGDRFYVVPDANRWHKIRLARMAIKLLWIVLRERPDIVISTGAAPGYFSLRFAKLIGARTIWVDSIANAERLSLSGLHAGRFADLWLTQWKHLAKPEGPRFEGSVL